MGKGWVVVHDVVAPGGEVVETALDAILTGPTAEADAAAVVAALNGRPAVPDDEGPARKLGPCQVSR